MSPGLIDGETHDIERPDYEGIINGNADRIDVTQYLFKCDAVEQGYFVRMSVQYANIGAVQLAWGRNVIMESNSMVTAALRQGYWKKGF